MFVSAPLLRNRVCRCECAFLCECLSRDWLWFLLYVTKHCSVLQPIYRISIKNGVRFAFQAGRDCLFTPYIFRSARLSPLSQSSHVALCAALVNIRSERNLWEDCGLKAVNNTYVNYTVYAKYSLLSELREFVHVTHRPLRNKILCICDELQRSHFWRDLRSAAWLKGRSDQTR